MRLRHLSDPDSLPALDKSFAIERPALGLAPDAPPVRILLLYGSLRARSFSRLAVEEAAGCCNLWRRNTHLRPVRFAVARSSAKRRSPGRQGAARPVRVVRGTSLVQPGTPRSDYQCHEGAD